MSFPAPYKKLPDSVKLFHGKNPINLSLEAEELATWWAECELTEFGSKSKVKENFWNSFKVFLTD